MTTPQTTLPGGLPRGSQMGPLGLDTYSGVVAPGNTMAANEVTR